MGVPNIFDLTAAFRACTCSNIELCKPSCRACHSGQWTNEPCVQQLWHDHTISDEGKLAAKQFSEMLDGQPSIDEICRAATLCTCGTVCTRSCDTCSSVTWKNGPCVKQLQHNMFGTIHDGDYIATVPMPAEYGGGTVTVAPSGDVDVIPIVGAQFPGAQWDEMIDQFIDHMEEQGYPVLPWQATAFRAIFRHR